MLQSLLFVPTLRETPKEAEVISHQLLLRGGYIRQNAAGIYSYLPLAYRVIQKISTIIRDELDSIGCSELLMPAMQPKDIWVESGRWDVYGKELVRLQDRHDREFCLGPTHEEVITTLVREYVSSYKKLPLALYQIQTKFRDEFRPRFGLMRGREFIMKDLYTFHATDEDLDMWYEKVRIAYRNTLDRLQLHYRAVHADSGQIGGSSSEEFMVLCDIGEDTIAYSDTGTFATNVELANLKEGDPSPDGIGQIKLAKGIEAGHVFKLGTKYSEPMNATFIDKDQTKKPIIMGCYGMGISRLLMAIIEQNNRGTKVLWPKSTAPFMVHIIPVEKEGSDSYNIAYDLYQSLLRDKIEVLFDNRDERAGVKFGDADLIGSPYRIIVGKKAAHGIVEVKELLTDQVTEVQLKHLDCSAFRYTG
jgi:prolyl-tRNA synthetase